MLRPGKLLYWANHRFMTNMQRRIYGHATDVAIRPLNEEKAVQAAADLLGELFVFTVVYIMLQGLLSYLRCKEVLDQKLGRRNWGKKKCRYSDSIFIQVDVINKFSLFSVSLRLSLMSLS
ncbi:uncharacterized protein LOC114289371 isoform X4 [Camellia sinensis]|uniref:uncharacterized protein LOC114289371 isoform X4 n=1 Tax=Camellia sinensis TaxID=4442 RepID=UPI0010364ADD|nr:uncharacterized protein LOC114289371 isoform X4 [Camellia sinensis]